MRKNFKPNSMLFPMPVLIISTFNEDGSVDCMNAAWGTMEDINVILLELTSDHRTSENIIREECFSVAIGDKKNVVACDYVGIVSNKKEKNKFEKTGWSYSKGKMTNSPIIEDFPVSLECKLERISRENGDFEVYGRIVNVSVNEEYLKDGHLDLEKCEFITYNSSDHSYRTISKKVADAFKVGLSLK